MERLLEWLHERWESLGSLFEVVRRLGMLVWLYFVCLGVVAISVFLGPVTEKLISSAFTNLFAMPKMIARLPSLIYSKPLLSLAVVVNLIGIATYFYFQMQSNAGHNVIRGRRTESARQVRRTLERRNSAVKSLPRKPTSNSKPIRRRGM